MGEMKITRVRVDGQSFVLVPGSNVKLLKAKIVEAARQGAGFVKFKTVGRSTISVMITPHVGVRFETAHEGDAQVEEWQEHPPAIDLDLGAYDQTA